MPEVSMVKPSRNRPLSPSTCPVGVVGRELRLTLEVSLTDKAGEQEFRGLDRRGVRLTTGAGKSTRWISGIAGTSGTEDLGFRFLREASESRFLRSRIDRLPSLFATRKVLVRSETDIDGNDSLLDFVCGDAGWL